MVQTKALKPAKTFDEQIDILIERKLTIHNIVYAREILKTINYYRLSAYFKPYYKQNVEEFKDGVTFDNIYHLYLFDKELRTILSSLMATVEISFRTHISYYIAHKYGIEGYLNPRIYFNVSRHRDLLDLINNEISKSREVFIDHYKRIYSGKFPIWVIVEILPFGAISTMFKNLRMKTKSLLH